MPWRTKWVKPKLAFKCHRFVRFARAQYKHRQAINVYHCYKDDDHDQRLTYWYTLGDGLDSWGDPTHIHNFDLRDFPTYDETLSHQQIMQTAIDQELCTIEDIMIEIQPIDRSSTTKH